MNLMARNSIYSRSLKQFNLEEMYTFIDGNMFHVGIDPFKELGLS